jgi:hypothetical protein
MTEPLTITFDVACSIDHAFDLWTSRIDTWWPANHTVTAEPDLTVILQGEVGGRIFERTSAGAEHEWGRITVWDPPARLSYTWHLRADLAEATEVDIRFHRIGARETRVDIEHRGWDRLGVAGPERRAGNHLGWAGIIPHYLRAVDISGANISGANISRAFSGTTARPQGD